MKKKLKALLAISLVSIIAFPACQKQGTGNQLSDELFVALGDTSIERFSVVELELGEDVKEVSWSSSDESVAIVEDGELVGLKAGTAVISAVRGNEKQEQTITVIDEGKKPTMDVAYLPVMRGDSYKMDVKAIFNGVELSDATFSYSVADTSIATFEKDVLKGVAYGETTVTISLSWRGQENVATKTVPCTVMKNVAVYTDKAEYQLYTLAEVLGETFEKETQIQPSVYYEGKKVEDLSLTWESADTSIATIDNTGKISAVAYGETYVVGKCEYNGEQLSTRQVPVKVEKPHVKTTMELPFKVGSSAMNFESVGYSVGRIVNLETGVDYVCTDNVADLKSLEAGEYTFALYEENDAYSAEVEVIIADYLVTNKAELQEATAAWEAYVVLMNDINVGKFKTTNSIRGQRSKGTFNGLGHTLTITYANGNRSLYSYVRDFVFKNLGVICTITTDNNTGALFYQGSAILDNCYIETTITKEDSFYVGGIGDYGSLNISNTIVKVNGLGISEYVLTHCGALLGRLPKAQFESSNTYVISEEGTLTTDAYGGTYADWLNAKEGLLYRSEQAVIEAKKNGEIVMEGFNHYWDLTGDFPVFKSCKE